MIPHRPNTAMSPRSSNHLGAGQATRQGVHGGHRYPMAHSQSSTPGNLAQTGPSSSSTGTPSSITAPSASVPSPSSQMIRSQSAGHQTGHSIGPNPQNAYVSPALVTGPNAMAQDLVTTIANYPSFSRLVLNNTLIESKIQPTTPTAMETLLALPPCEWPKHLQSLDKEEMLKVANAVPLLFPDMPLVPYLETGSKVEILYRLMDRIRNDPINVGHLPMLRHRTDLLLTSSLIKHEQYRHRIASIVSSFDAPQAWYDAEEVRKVYHVDIPSRKHEGDTKSEGSNDDIDMEMEITAPLLSSDTSDQEKKEKDETEEADPKGGMKATIIRKATMKKLMRFLNELTNRHLSGGATSDCPLNLAFGESRDRSARRRALQQAEGLVLDSPRLSRMTGVVRSTGKRVIAAPRVWNHRFLHKGLGYTGHILLPIVDRGTLAISYVAQKIFESALKMTTVRQERIRRLWNRVGKGRTSHTRIVKEVVCSYLNDHQAWCKELHHHHAMTPWLQPAGLYRDYPMDDTYLRQASNATGIYGHEAWAPMVIGKDHEKQKEELANRLVTRESLSVMSMLMPPDASDPSSAHTFAEGSEGLPLVNVVDKVLEARDVHFSQHVLTQTLTLGDIRQAVACFPSSKHADGGLRRTSNSGIRKMVNNMTKDYLRSDPKTSWAARSSRPKTSKRSVRPAELPVYLGKSVLRRLAYISSIHCMPQQTVPNQPRGHPISKWLAILNTLEIPEGQGPPTQQQRQPGPVGVVGLQHAGMMQKGSGYGNHSHHGRR